MPPSPLVFVLWLWRQDELPDLYQPRHVARMARLLRNHVRQPHRVICITDFAEQIDGVEVFPLWPDHAAAWYHDRPSCYRRLKIFDPATQADLRITPGSRVVSLDLDLDLFGELDPLFDRPHAFIGWRVRGERRRWVFNGSVFQFVAGEGMAYIWREFHIETSPARAAAAGFLGTDQAWLSARLIEIAASWGFEDGIWSRRFDRVAPPVKRIRSYCGEHWTD